MIAPGIDRTGRNVRIRCLKKLDTHIQSLCPYFLFNEFTVISIVSERCLSPFHAVRLQTSHGKIPHVRSSGSYPKIMMWPDEPHHKS